MARPLPNTNAPALVKNHAICNNVFNSNCQKPKPVRNTTFATEDLLNQFGGDFMNIYSKPVAMKRSTCSCSVSIVITAAIKKNNHSIHFSIKDFILISPIDFSVSL